MPNEFVGTAANLPDLSSLTLIETPAPSQNDTRVQARSWVSPALLELDESSWRRPNAQPSIDSMDIDRYIAAYQAMALQATQGLGIPSDAMPKLSTHGQQPTLQAIREARNHLELMIQSFLSASL